MFLFALIATRFAVVLAATKIYVATYDGNVTTLSLDTPEASPWSINAISRNGNCSFGASWLTHDPEAKKLYCISEDTPGGITSFDILESGDLKTNSSVKTLRGPVHATRYGVNGLKGLALAHYSGGFSTVFDKSPLQIGETFNFTATSGTNTTGNTASVQSHAHQAILDPKGKFLFIPDLGTDQLRVATWNSSGNVTFSQQTWQFATGFGPRHGAFWSPPNMTSPLYLMVVGEPSNNVTVFSVNYGPNDWPILTPVFNTTTFGGRPAPSQAKAAEIIVSPDKRFILISNRNDSSIAITNPDRNNQTKLFTDSVYTYKPNVDGTLDFVQRWTAGGSFPRHFSLNKDGNLVAVGLQNSNKLMIFSRDKSTGFLGQHASLSVALGASPMAVVWDENGSSRTVGKTNSTTTLNRVGKFERKSRKL